MKTNIHFLPHLAHFFLEWEMFQTKVVEKIKTHILYSATFSLEDLAFRDKVGKYSRVGQSTDDDMAHVHCMLDT